MKKPITNYTLYRDASKDSLHPKYETSTGVMKELYRWFGPSPMRAPLNLRINNRELMIDSHIRILGQNPEKRITKTRRGETKNILRKTNQWLEETQM